MIVSFLMQNSEIFKNSNNIIKHHTHKQSSFLDYSTIVHTYSIKSIKIKDIFLVTLLLPFLNKLNISRSHYN